MLKAIEEVLDNNVRPYLLEHHGDLEITSYKNGVLNIRLLGQCHNCPSAKFTIEETIESSLRKNIPGFKKVILDTDISAELYDFARKILRKNSSKS